MGVFFFLFYYEEPTGIKLKCIFNARAKLHFATSFHLKAYQKARMQFLFFSSKIQN